MPTRGALLTLGRCVLAVGAMAVAGEAAAPIRRRTNRARWS
jgi:hypothetical protein